MLLMATAASASDDFSGSDIAKLPQEKVAAIKDACARKWGDDFRMREYCENQQYEALQRLIVRGSVGPKGERL
jgi:hypothetical protein